MTADRGVDEVRIFRRHVFRPLSLMCYAIALLLFGLQSWEIIDRDAVRDRHMILTITAGGAEPVVARKAQLQLSALETTWAFKLRHLIQWGPTVLAYVLFVPLIVGGIRGKRAVDRAKAGQCTDCGYDLRGSGPMNACPECGAPPAPRLEPKQVTGTRRKQAVLGVVIIVVIFGAVMGPQAAGLLAIRQEARIIDAFEEAPCVVVRDALVVSEHSRRQYAALAERESGLCRQEWWKDGRLQDAMLTPAPSGYERFLLDGGVVQVPAADVPTQRRNRFRTFVDLDLDVNAGIVWYGESERLPSDPAFEVYWQGSRSPLHAHQAKDIKVVVIETRTRRLRYVWRGSFKIVVNPDETPPLESLWITEIEYPDTPPAPEMRQLDDGRPGLLYKEMAVFPDWLDRAWVNPVRR